MAYWWRADKISQDELMRALRNEISKTVFLTHLHIENLAVNAWDEGVRNDVENLIEPLWVEYSKRSENFRLQLSDLVFEPPLGSRDAMRLHAFCLRQHNFEGESHWALVQNLSLLESILQQPRKLPMNIEHSDGDGQPRKRLRSLEGLVRLRLRLMSRDAGTQRTALQLVPFLLECNRLDTQEVEGMLATLVACAQDKDTLTASWAMIALAR
jgi:ataxia telangiectasia mutated family protein